jgi:uncharacterized membrane protein YeaQ/YmgE (transglycosylase-associated protein family)
MMNMYENSRGSVRQRALRIARQRGLIGEGGNGMVITIVLLVIAVLAGLWAMATIGSLFFALIPWAIVGLLTGWVATRITGARLTTGWTLLAGITGSWLGGALFAGLLGIKVGGLLSPIHLLASVLGATILITLARVVARPALPGAPRARLPY